MEIPTKFLLAAVVILIIVCLFTYNQYCENQKHLNLLMRCSCYDEKTGKKTKNGKTGKNMKNEEYDDDPIDI